MEVAKSIRTASTQIRQRAPIGETGRLAILFGIVSMITSCAPFQQRAESLQLQDEAENRGLAFTYLAGGTQKYRLPEIMGGGVALVDADQDGDLDVYIVQSGSLDESLDAHANALFVNDGEGRFMQLNAGDASNHLGYGMGVAVGDFDNDGLPDLFITQHGPNVLLQNRGTNQFADVSAAAGFDFDAWSTAAAFGDFDADGDLDLWVVNYIEWSETMEPECYQAMLGSRDYCSPSHYNAPAQDRVFRNDGAGEFVEVTGPAGVLGTKGNGLGVVVADMNHDGLVDVFVANDTSPNHLWLNQGEFQFNESCSVWNCAVDQHGVARAGMGIVTTDLNDDAKQDIMIVNITTEPNFVFQNEDGYFRDTTSSAGLNIHTQRFTRFGLVVEDLNNDGWLDIFEANGAVSRLSKPHDGDKYAEPNSLYQGSAGGRFELIRRSDAIRTSRGAAVGDIDNDGRLDIVVVDRDAPVVLLMNQSGTSGNWLLLDIRDRHGRAALGATVSLDIGHRTLTRVVQRAGSYLSSRDPRVHFGLGEAESVSNIRIRWLSGAERLIERLEINQVHTVEENR